MTWVRHMTDQFSLVYLRPKTVVRAINEILPSDTQHQSALSQTSGFTPRNPLDRRSYIDRRQHQHRILIDTRSPHARRHRSDRRRANAAGGPPHDRDGIDVYA